MSAHAALRVAVRLVTCTPPLTAAEEARQAREAGQAVALARQCAADAERDQ
jgi:hypothetical protein